MDFVLLPPGGVYVFHKRVTDFCVRRRVEDESFI